MPRSTRTAPGRPPNGPYGVVRLMPVRSAARTASRAVYRVVPAGGGKVPKEGWQVQHKEGRSTVREPHRTQKQAIDAARRQAVEHKPAQVVHGTDGRIRTEYTYGSDPWDIPG
ncbi:DUF2188 domain-containing protein [Streptomyces sp. NPDC057217]|uniref:DUF2188 domain-containing protein n=1 Tax=Streptomyces sp. NPDC057217 TaxID=3346054 RepID=UPI003625BE23